jgi:hypothetical protein
MNQQENREDDIKTESLADLELTGEQAEETRAGGTGKVESFLAFPGFNGGVFVAS